MSEVTGKKKRGAAGASNAKNIPFRYRGVPRGYTLSQHHGGTNHPRLAGARLISTMVLAKELPGFHPSHRLMKATENAVDHIIRCHPNTKTAREWTDV